MAFRTSSDSYAKFGVSIASSSQKSEFLNRSKELEKSVCSRNESYDPSPCPKQGK